jgi:hypothetical protein
VEAAEQGYQTAKSLLLTLGGLALVAGVVASWLIVKSLLNQLGGEPSYAVKIAERIAGGDLSMEIRVDEKHPHSLMHAMRICEMASRYRWQSSNRNRNNRICFTPDCIRKYGFV